MHISISAQGNTLAFFVSFCVSYSFYTKSARCKVSFVFLNILFIKHFFNNIQYRKNTDNIQQNRQNKSKQNTLPAHRHISRHKLCMSVQTMSRRCLRYHSDSNIDFQILHDLPFFICFVLSCFSLCSFINE